MTGRGAALAVAVVGVVLVGVLLLGAGAPSSDDPLDPRSHEPGGTSALVALLRELDATVDVGAGQPGDDVDVALVLVDRFDDAGRDQLRGWVRDGGVLVVSDPSSPLTPVVAGLGAAVAVETDTLDVEAASCNIEALDDPGELGTLAVYGGPLRYEVRPQETSCFGDGEEAYVVAREVGDGTIVALGGSGILVNRVLDEADNAPVAAALLAPREGTRVAVLDPTLPASGEGESLIDLIPAGVKRGLVQLGIAFLVYALWRARRLGRPVDEPQPVKVAGSELVSAVGGLLERSKSPQHAADVLRADLRRDLAQHLGLPPAFPPENVVPVVAARTPGLDTAQVQAALGPGPVTTDQDLLTVVRLIDFVRKEVLEHVGT